MTFSALLRISAVLLVLAGWGRADTIEFINGSQLEGKLRPMNAAEQTLTIEAGIGGRSITREYSKGQVHAVTVNGQRTVLTPKSGSAAVVGTSRSRVTRTPAEVQALIKQFGSTPPAWLASTPVNFPP